jgi:hypothetical protein
MILTLQREAQIGDLKVSEIDLTDKRLTSQRGRVKNKGVVSMSSRWLPSPRDPYCTRSRRPRVCVREMGHRVVLTY